MIDHANRPKSIQKKSKSKLGQEVTAPVIAMLANETKSRQDEIWNKVTDAVKKYSDNSGHVKFSNEAICIAGKK